MYLKSQMLHLSSVSVTKFKLNLNLGTSKNEDRETNFSYQNQFSRIVNLLLYGPLKIGFIYFPPFHNISLTSSAINFQIKLVRLPKFVLGIQRLVLRTDPNLRPMFARIIALSLNYTRITYSHAINEKRGNMESNCTTINTLPFLLCYQTIYMRAPTFQFQSLLRRFRRDLLVYFINSFN